MFRWAALFLVIALVAGAFGLFQVKFVAAHVAWVLFACFLVFSVAAFLLGRRWPPD